MMRFNYYIITMLLFLCCALTSCAVDYSTHYTTDENGIYTFLGKRYNGDFSIVEEYTVQRGDKIDIPTYNYWSPDETVIYVIEDARFPGFTFKACHYRGTVLHNYVTNLYYFLCEQYMEEHDDFAFANYARSNWNVVTCFYDNYADIEAGVANVEGFISYITENYPFAEMGQSDNFQIGVFLAHRDDAIYNSFSSIIYFNRLGMKRSAEQEVLSAQISNMNYMERYEYGYDYLPEERLDEYMERLAATIRGESLYSAQAAAYSAAAGYNDYPIRKLGAATYAQVGQTLPEAEAGEPLNPSYRDAHGLSVGSFYMLCGRLGLETEGDSRTFEVTGVDGARYWFSYYFFYGHDRDEFLKCLYFRNEVPLYMGSAESVPFSVIEQVTGQQLVPNAPDGTER